MSQLSIFFIIAVVVCVQQLGQVKVAADLVGIFPRRAANWSDAREYVDHGFL